MRSNSWFNCPRGAWVQAQGGKNNIGDTRNRLNNNNNNNNRLYLQDHKLYFENKNQNLITGQLSYFVNTWSRKSKQCKLQNIFHELYTDVRINITTFFNFPDMFRR